MYLANNRPRWFKDWTGNVARAVQQCIAWKAETVLLLAIEPIGYPNGEVHLFVDMWKGYICLYITL